MTRIIADSACDISESYKDKILVANLSIFFNEEEYVDGVTIDKRTFYEKLIECDTLPTTSQPTPAAFEELYEQVTKDGDEAVVITISGKLSGTFQSACIAKEDYDNIYVVDSETVAVASGILAQYGYELAQKGMSAKEIYEILETKKKDICIVALLDTLEYLKKGGRISKTVAFAGSVLGIKPVVTTEDGEVALIGKARGSKQGNNLLVQKIEERGGIDFDMPILLGYSGLSDSLLTKYINDSAHLWKDMKAELEYTLLCSVIGTHVGPGAICAAFFVKA